MSAIMEKWGRKSQLDVYKFLDTCNTVLFEKKINWFQLSSMNLQRDSIVGTKLIWINRETIKKQIF